MAETCDLRIELANLSYSYGTNSVFSGLCAEFQSSGIHLITGANGTGKSTLLKLLAGLLEAEPGQIHYELAGQKLAHDQLYRHVSACASWVNLPENLRVAEFFALVKGFKAFVGNYGVAEILSRANLGACKTQLIKNLSDGQYQRVALFYALFVQSAFSVLDEPLRALDQDSQHLYRAALAEVSQYKTLFISSHRAEFYADIPRIHHISLCPST